MNRITFRNYNYRDWCDVALSARADRAIAEFRALPWYRRWWEWVRP